MKEKTTNVTAALLTVCSAGALIFLFFSLTKANPDCTVNDNLIITGNVGIGQVSPLAEFVINDGLSDAGGENDSLSIYSNTAGSIIYAEQNGSGYAGYFSGKVRVDGDLDVSGSYFKLPHLTIAERDALSSESGMMIYNTEANEINVFIDTEWKSFGITAVAKASGEPCSDSLSCASGYCTDGVCCDSACYGSTCQTCGTYSSAGVGTCGYVNSSAQDLDSECTQGSTSSTGCSTEFCSGTGYACGAQTSGDGGCPNCYTCSDTDIACEYHSSGTLDCGGGGYCVSGSCINPPLTWSGSSHFEMDCINLGGVVYDTGATGTICKYTGSTVPAGWIQADNWQVYSASAFPGGDICGRYLSSGPTNFSNVQSTIQSAGTYLGDTTQGCAGDDARWHADNPWNSSHRIYNVSVSINGSSNRLEIGIY